MGPDAAMAAPEETTTGHSQSATNGSTLPSGRRTVLRRHEADRYVSVSNDLAQDGRLSYGARGLLLAMISRPDDWSFSADRLAAGSPTEGRDWVWARQRELRDHGYLRTVTERGPSGRLVKVTYVSSRPVAEWLTEMDRDATTPDAEAAR